MSPDARIITGVDPGCLDPRFAWYAYDDRTYSGTLGEPYGRGRTREEAIADLMEQLEEAGPHDTR